MSYKNDQSHYIILARVFVLLSVIGLGVLIVANLGDDPSHLAFSLIAFVISVAALLMTILQSSSIAHQVHVTERAAREIRVTGEQLKELASSDHLLATEIRQDIKLDHEIIAILEEHGVGDDDEQRHTVAKRIAQKLGQRQTHNR